MIDGVAGADIGADHKVIHGGFPESLVIERVELFGHLVVAEILTVQVAGAQQIAEAGIAFVIAVGGVVADGPPDLVGFVVAAEHCSRRNTYHTVYRDALLHQNIQNTGGEHAPHGTASRINPVFIRVILLLLTMHPARTDGRMQKTGTFPCARSAPEIHPEPLLPVYSVFAEKQERKCQKTLKTGGQIRYTR